MIQSIERALKIVELLANEQAGLPLRAIAQRQGLLPATAHSILKTLSATGYVEQDSLRASYRLGIKPYLLAAKPSFWSALAGVAHPILQKLHQAFDECVVLATLKNDELLVVAMIESDHLLSVNPTTARRPVHCTGTGKLLLSYLPEAHVRNIVRRQGLPRFTSQTITTVDCLIEDLKEIRAQGYAIADEEGDMGVSAIGVPVRNALGVVIASLGIYLPKIRFASRSKAIISALIQGGRELSSKLEMPQKEKERL
ncbi:MAG: IclR family transcriptional regulator [Verrucomicrobiae bacterium]|nr:IclR family transcriptional regulator [Verrucomicrobiae bacterium]